MIAVGAALLCGVASAQSQEQTPPQSETETNEQPNGDSEGNSDLGTGGLRSRPGQLDGPVASEGWVNSAFTGFIDVRQRLNQPDSELLEKGLRLITSGDFPPFNSIDDEGNPEGYNVELAREMCEELNTPCTLKIVPFRSIPALISSGQADAALAGIVNHPQLQEWLSHSDVYLQRPARFLRLKDTLFRVNAHSLDGEPVAVRGGTAHDAYLKTYFPNINRVPVTDLADASRLLIDGKVKAIFGDAFNMLPMVSAENSQFIFTGKPYYDTHFFGDGMTVAVKAGHKEMKDLINYGLLKLTQKGRMAELYARHFAMDVYATY